MRMGGLIWGLMTGGLISSIYKYSTLNDIDYLYLSIAWTISLILLSVAEYHLHTISKTEETNE